MFWSVPTATSESRLASSTSADVARQPGGAAGFSTGGPDSWVALANWWGGDSASPSPCHATRPARASHPVAPLGQHQRQREPRYRERPPGLAPAPACAHLVPSVLILCDLTLGGGGGSLGQRTELASLISAA